MSSSPPNGSNAVPSCGCGKHLRSACQDLSPDYEYEGTQFCVLHYPSTEKSEAFNEVLKRKLESQDFNFRGVWFPESVAFVDKFFSKKVDFSGAFFNQVVSFIETKFLKADFSNATFNLEANFYKSHFDAEANFSYVRFKAETNFAHVIFSEGANFNHAAFSEKAIFASAKFYLRANLERVKFEAEANFDFSFFAAPTSFLEAVFNAEAHFIETTFGISAHFGRATFRDFVQFEGTEKQKMFRNVHPDQQKLSVQPYLDLRSVKIASAKHISFNNMTLRPHWFIKVKAHDLTFSNARWEWHATREEIKSLENRNITTPHELLGIACRQLADNMEADHLYEDASRFRFMAMEARRLGTWKGFVPWRLSWWYWLVSGYGERTLRAFGILAGVWLLYALLYTQVGFLRWETSPKNRVETGMVATQYDEVGAPLKLPRALTYSLSVMTLQKPEPRPATTSAHILVITETILGPVQAALLALAIRRKFMR